MLAYGTVADLLADIDAATLEKLPEVQRIAVDRVLLREASGGPETDQHVVAAALLSVIEALATDAPVVVGHRRRAVARPVEQGGGRVRGAATAGPGRTDRHRAHRSGPRQRDVLAATRPTRRHRPDAGALAEPGRPARTAERQVGPLVLQAGDGADRRGVRRQSVLRAGDGPGDRHRTRLAPFAFRARADPDRRAGPRHPGRASGRRLRGRADGGHARPRHRYDRRAHGDASRRGGGPRNPRDHRQPGVLRASAAGPRGLRRCDARRVAGGCIAQWPTWSTSPS